ncbi:MAG TPA: sel1 repeat family protein [Caulobacteraceae bacterium]|nr:sel1 repeat family protein [Caulobacteraceae bacterium]
MSETTVKAPAPGESADTLFQMGLKLSTGGEADPIVALALFDMAARFGSIEAKIYRRELSDEMNPDDILEARQLVREWLGSVEPVQR